MNLSMNGLNDKEKRNSKILIAAALLFSAVYLLGVLACQCTWIGDFQFQYHINPKNGVRSSLFVTWIVYIFIFGALGMLPAAVNFLFVQGVWMFLHRGENIPRMHTTEDYHVGGHAAFMSSYAVSAVIGLLHVFNVIHIKL